MEEQFQGGVCGGSWWINPSTNLFRSSPCSSSITGPGSFGWPGNDLPPTDQAARSLSDDSTGSASDGPGSVAIASSLQMMGINFSSSATTDAAWNQDLLHKNGKSEENYSHNLPAACLIGQAGMNSYGPGFQLNPASFNYSSPLLQTLLDVNSDQPGPQTLLSNHRSANYGPSQDYASPSGFHPTLRSKVQETQQHENIHLQFTNNGPFWNGLGSGFVPSNPTQLVHPSSLNSSKPNFHNLNTKKHTQETGRGSNAAAAPKKGGHEAAATKRPRVEAPPPLPAFKVRKEKLGDRITALQQLVSPFGKTDTASVLHEAIEYIKFLHEQVNVLSTPYLKKGSPPLQHQQMQGPDADGVIEDLQSRGLCLVPISTTFPVAAETATDFWAPTFGGCFR